LCVSVSIVNFALPCFLCIAKKNTPPRNPHANIDAISICNGGVHFSLWKDYAGYRHLNIEPGKEVKFFQFLCGEMVNDETLFYSGAISEVMENKNRLNNSVFGLQFPCKTDLKLSTS